MTVEKMLLKRDEVTEMVGYSPSTLNRRVNAGDFPRPLDLGGRVRLWRKDQIEAWIDDHTSAA